MARFLARVTYTPEAWQGMIANEVDRAAVVSKLFEGLGGKLELFYYALEGSDVVSTISVPDNVTAAIASRTVAAAGAVASITMTPLLTSDELAEVIRRTPETAYRPTNP
jgi:uncharacterized protein with GYD domain